jgi:hypothetical protein
LPAAAGGDAREAALLSAVSMCFALGAATAEQLKHLAPAEAGPLAGLAALPSLRTLRPALAAIADRTDPLALQAAFAAAMLAASPETSGVMETPYPRNSAEGPKGQMLWRPSSHRACA